VSSDSLAAKEDFAAVRRRVLVFSLLGLLTMVVTAALFERRSASPQSAAQALLQAAQNQGSAIGWDLVPAMIVIGFGAGLLAGIIGMGGGVLKVSGMLVIFGFDIFFARAISVVTMFFSSASALWQYVKEDLVLWDYARPMICLALPAAVFAAAFGNYLTGASLTHLFGLFCIFLAFNTLALIFADPAERIMAQQFKTRTRGTQGYRCAAIGAAHGGLCGLLGISGGVIATPMQQIALQVPLRHAIANTLLTSTVVTAVASVVVLWIGAERGDFSISDVVFVDLFMGSGAAAAAPLGAKLGERCNVTALRLLFVTLTLAAGVSIVF